MPSATQDRYNRLAAAEADRIDLRVYGAWLAEGRSFTKVARQLGCTPQWVAYRVKRCLKRHPEVGPTQNNKEG